MPTTDEKPPESIPETEYLREEAAGARRAMRRTVREIKHAGGQLAHPGQTFRQHPWIAGGVVIGVGALVGFGVYELFFKEKKKSKYPIAMVFADADFRRTGSRIAGPVVKAATSLAAKFVKVFMDDSDEPEEQTNHRHKLRTR